MRNLIMVLMLSLSTNSSLAAQYSFVLKISEFTQSSSATGFYKLTDTSGNQHRLFCHDGISSISIKFAQNQTPKEVKIDDEDCRKTVVFATGSSKDSPTLIEVESDSLNLISVKRFNP